MGSTQISDHEEKVFNRMCDFLLFVFFFCLHQQAELSSVQMLVVNCMSLRSSHSIFPLLADKLRASGGQNGLQKFLTAPGPAV